MGFEPTTFGLEVQRASPLRYAGLGCDYNYCNYIQKVLKFFVKVQRREEKIIQERKIVQDTYWISLHGISTFFEINFSLKICALPGGLEPPTFRLTAERANQLRHGGIFINS